MEISTSAHSEPGGTSTVRQVDSTAATKVPADIAPHTRSERGDSLCPEPDWPSRQQTSSSYSTEQLSAWEQTQHVITNVVVDLDGDTDTASVRANLIATHVRAMAKPSPDWQVGAKYTFAATRTAAGWRLFKLVLEPLWVAD